MASKRLSRVMGSQSYGKDTYAYVCDTETDVSSLPDDCTVAIVLEHDAVTSPVRIRNASGEWKELG